MISRSTQCQCMAVVGDQFSEERMHRNALSLSIEYTTRDTYNSDQLSMIVVLYR